MLDEREWFTEVSQEAGSAFSLKLKGKLEEVETPYQKIEIYDTETYGHLMVIDGCIMLTERDNFLYHEMLAHPAMFSHPCPQDIAIIGGGDCGTLKEVLKHPSVKSLTQIDIDEQVTVLAKRYFPALCVSNDSPKARLLFQDGIAWMKASPPESLDVILVDSTDPVGPAEGLFTEAFFRDCRKALRPGGILAQQSESPLYHNASIIQPLRKAMQQAGFQAVKTFQFPQPCYPSGWWSVTLAGNDLSQVRWQDIDEKSFSTHYYSKGIHAAAAEGQETFSPSV